MVTKETEQDLKEEDEEEIVEEKSMKKKIFGCINKEESEKFLTYIQSVMVLLVEQIKNEWNIMALMHDLISALKTTYDDIGLFKNNGAADTNDIVSTVSDAKGTAWRKHLEGKTMLDQEDYNNIVEALVRSCLFQEGKLLERLISPYSNPRVSKTKQK